MKQNPETGKASIAGITATPGCIRRGVGTIVLLCLGLGVSHATPVGTLKTLHAFQETDGSDVRASLLVSGSNLLGTTYHGGSGRQGTIFKLGRSGTVTTLHAFDGTDGSFPFAALVSGPLGTFYGTTYGGTGTNNGTLFKITSTGILTTLHAFSGTDGAQPYSLVRGSDGNFYGTTFFGGSSDQGTVFKMSAAGKFQSLHSFAGGDGANPHQAALIQAADGNLYGTTLNGGTFGNGTVFRIGTNGSFASLFSFDGVHGSNPQAALLQAIDGNFYGTTDAGGQFGYGTVFRITSAGAITTLHSFAPASGDGASPTAALIQAADGNFYGTTSLGGASNNGTVFQITPDGALTILHSFDGTDGTAPLAPLVQKPTSANVFYGTTDFGGASGDGTAFSITVQP